MSDTSAQKARLRPLAFEARVKAHRAAQADPARLHMAQARLLEFLEPFRGHTLSGYMPIRSEIDPLPVMAEMAESGFVTVPVIAGAGQALKFRQWQPGCQMVAGPFGAQVPAQGAWLEPEILIVPLVAFAGNGARLGYGGGYYDRSLQMLRERRKTIAVGFSYQGQQCDELPTEPTDQPLDALVTEEETLRF